MDKRIRKNEICIVNLPRCDFVFSSTRTCFIAYGFNESTLEMNILGRLLEDKGIQAIEAGGALAPGQNVFCAKICSKIITSQFCIVLINNEEKNGNEIPNANVNMEYGLMLGFNKYVIPFQRDSQKLPFNLAGLDTVKYSDRDFERLAAQAIDQAIVETAQHTPIPIEPDQLLGAYLITRRMTYSPVKSDGDQSLYEIGSSLGFNLLNDFSGFKYVYFGNFTNLRNEAVLWRIKMLDEFLNSRMSTLPQRVMFGVSLDQVNLGSKVLSEAEMWILVTSNENKDAIKNLVHEAKINHNFEIISRSDIELALQEIAVT